MTDDKHSKCPFGYGSTDTPKPTGEKPNPKNVREIEDGVKKDFANDMSYGDYLKLNPLLSLQNPLSDEHDEMLFIIIHQASELWIKLAVFELESAMTDIKNRNFDNALKKLARISRIQEQLTQSWTILATLTPSDYLKFRDDLGHSSGFQSYGYRTLEFLLGNKNPDMLNVHKHDDDVYNTLKKHGDAPSVYDLTIQVLAEHFPIDQSVLNRDFTQPYTPHDSVQQAWKTVYENAEEYWILYALGEKLVDIEDSFQMWRFRHLSTVTRIIGFRTGTGGSSGVAFLKKALDIRFFPELFDVRTVL